MTTAAVQPAPAAPPLPSTPGPADLDEILSEARKGSVLILGARGFSGGLSIQSLAVQALLRALGGNGSGAKVTILTGSAPEAGAARLSRHAFGGHEKGWIDSGGVFEKMLDLLAADQRDEGGAATAGMSFSHVFCMDPWTAGVQTPAKPLLSSARWIYVSDLDIRGREGDAEYWTEYQSWIGDRPFDGVIPVRLFLPLLPEGFWTPGDAAGLRSALGLPPRFVRTMLEAHVPNRVSGCWRIPLDETTTAHILTGNLDPVALFNELHKLPTPGSVPGVRQGVLGYCQVVSREAFAEVMYPEEFDRINQSDIVFVDRLREKLGIEPQFLKDLFVLHLDHPRDWGGTKVFL